MYTSFKIIINLISWRVYNRAGTFTPLLICFDRLQSSLHFRSVLTRECSILLLYMFASRRIKNQMKKGGDCIDVLYMCAVCAVYIRLGGSAAHQQQLSAKQKWCESATGWINLLERRGGDQGVYRITQKTNLSISITRVLINCDHPYDTPSSSLFIFKLLRMLILLFLEGKTKIGLMEL